MAGASSRIAETEEVFTFGSPHSLYLYHKEPGNLLRLVDFIKENLHYYTHISNGCAIGWEHTVRAEYLLETGDTDQAGLSAEKAVFKARTKNQLCLVIDGSLCLARLAILNGRPDDATAVLSSLKSDVEAAGNPVLMNCLDIAFGYIYSCLEDPEQIPKWLREGDLSDCKLFKEGMGVNYFVIGRAAILRKSYAELEIIVETMRETYMPNNNLFGLIYAGIYEADREKAPVCPGRGTGRIAIGRRIGRTGRNRYAFC